MTDWMRTSGGTTFIGDTCNGVRVTTHSKGVMGTPDKLVADRTRQMVCKIVMLTTAFDFALGLVIYSLYLYFKGGK